MTDDFLNDPRFPNRPNTPDFWRMSSAVLKLDGQSDERSFDDIVNPLVDVKSVLYMATNRLRRPGFQLIPEAVWIDGFITGIVYQQEGGHRDE